MLITEEYRELNRELHEKYNYGSGSARWAPHVKSRISEFDFKTVLDYGCGQGKLKENVGDIVQEYDPAITEKSAMPQRADFVVCTDVLEHVEPKCLSSVLNHLQYLMKELGFFAISTRPAKKILSDKRNAHLIVESADWWRGRLSERFVIVKSKVSDDLLVLTVKPKQVEHALQFGIATTYATKALTTDTTKV